MKFTKGYSKLDNDWFSKDGSLQYLTADEKILLIYLGTIIIMKSPLYEKCGLLHASSRTDTIQKVCGFKNYRRWQATKGLDQKGIAIKAHSNGRHNIYLLGMDLLGTGRRTHYHNYYGLDNKFQGKLKIYDETFRTGLDEIQSKTKVRITSCSPTSSLNDRLEYKPLEEVL